MFDTTISGCRVGGFAGSGHTRVPVLEVGQTGVMLTLDMKIQSSPGAEISNLSSLSGIPTKLPPISLRYRTEEGVIENSGVSDLAFMYAMTYFDRVVYSVPSDPFMGRTLLTLSDTQRKFLELEATSIMPIYQDGASGNISSHSGRTHFDEQALKSFRSGCKSELTSLLERDGPNWQMGNHFYGLQLDRVVSKGGLLFELHDKLPVIADVKDPADFLRWKEDRRSQRHALGVAVSDFVGCLNTVDDATLRKKLKEIESLCADLVKVSKEKFPRVVLRPVKFGFNHDVAKLGGQYGGTVGGILGLLFDAPKEGAAVGAALGSTVGIRLKEGPVFAKKFIKNSPFASVLDLQYKS